MTRADLPIGTYVLVAERGSDARPPYYARIVGTDMFGSKYQVGSRYGGWGEWLFADGGSWAFPEWVTVVTEAQATALVRERPSVAEPMTAHQEPKPLAEPTTSAPRWDQPMTEVVRPADGTQTEPSSRRDGAAA